MEYFSGVFNDDLRHELWIKRGKVGADIQVKRAFDPKFFKIFLFLKDF